MMKKIKFTNNGQNHKKSSSVSHLYLFFITINQRKIKIINKSEGKKFRYELIFLISKFFLEIFCHFGSKKNTLISQANHISFLGIKMSIFIQKIDNIIMTIFKLIRFPYVVN